MFAAGLDAEPTVTTTGCIPSGTLLGMVKLICVTPTKPLGMPVNSTFDGGTAIPPTVIETGSVGTGVTACGDGVAPVASAGVTAPSPVIYIAISPPREALRYGLIVPSANVKI